MLSPLSRVVLGLRVVLIEVPGFSINLLICAGFLSSNRKLLPSNYLSLVICVFNLLSLASFETFHQLRISPSAKRNRFLLELCSTSSYYFFSYFIQLCILARTVVAYKGLVQQKQISNPKRLFWVTILFSCVVALTVTLLGVLQVSPLGNSGRDLESALVTLSMALFPILILISELIMLAVLVIHSLRRLQQQQPNISPNSPNINTPKNGNVENAIKNGLDKRKMYSNGEQRDVHPSSLNQSHPIEGEMGALRKHALRKPSNSRCPTGRGGNSHQVHVAETSSIAVDTQPARGSFSGGGGLIPDKRERKRKQGVVLAPGKDTHSTVLELWRQGIGKCYSSYEGDVRRQQSKTGAMGSKNGKKKKDTENSEETTSKYGRLSKRRSNEDNGNLASIQRSKHRSSSSSSSQHQEVVIGATPYRFYRCEYGEPLGVHSGTRRKNMKRGSGKGGGKGRGSSSEDAEDLEGAQVNLPQSSSIGVGQNYGQPLTHDYAMPNSSFTSSPPLSSLQSTINHPTADCVINVTSTSHTMNTGYNELPSIQDQRGSVRTMKKHSCAVSPMDEDALGDIVVSCSKMTSTNANTPGGNTAVARGEIHVGTGGTTEGYTDDKELRKHRRRIARNIVLSQLPLLVFRLPYVLLGEHFLFVSTTINLNYVTLVTTHLHLCFFAYNSIAFLATSQILRDDVRNVAVLPLVKIASLGSDVRRAIGRFVNRRRNRKRSKVVFSSSRYTSPSARVIHQYRYAHTPVPDYISSRPSRLSNTLLRNQQGIVIRQTYETPFTLNI